MATIDWKKLFEKYHGQWVALEDDEKTVITADKTAKKAWEYARKKGYEHPILHHVPDKLTTYVGGHMVR